MNDIVPFARAREALAVAGRDDAETPLLKPKMAGSVRAVLWVYRDYENRWCVRREGSDEETAWFSRLRAVEFARTLGLAAGSYRIFFELRDGRVIEEHFGARR